MAITNRDLKFLERLSDFGVLSTRQISEMFFQGIRKTTVLRRLRALEGQNLIHRSIGLSEGQYAWVLSSDGSRWIGAVNPLKTVNRNSLEHDVLLSQLRYSLNGVGIGRRWVPEHVLKARRTSSGHSSDSFHAIPDGLLTTTYNNRPVSVAIELEVQAKAKARYDKIFKRYSDMKSLFAVWYFVRNRSFGEMLQERYFNFKTYNSTRPQFIWSMLDDVLQDPWGLVLYQPKPVLVRTVFPLKKPAHTTAHTMSVITETKNSTEPTPTTENSA